MRKPGSRGGPFPRLSLVLTLAAASLVAGTATVPPDAVAANCNSNLLPPDFTSRVYRHIESVVARSPRPASSEGERKVAAYVRDRFQEMGLTTAVEEFEFGSYDIDDMQLRVGEFTLRPVSVGFNPYAGVFRFQGFAHFIDPQELSSGAQLPNIEDDYVISAQPADFFHLMVRKPKLVIFLSATDFGRLKGAPARRFALSTSGHQVRHRSANVIGLVGSPDAQREIVVSAHMDAHGNSPGASDNGSGLGVLIELARYFTSIEASLRTRVRFVAFGGEELGVQGSRAYVLKHAAELQRCSFNLNLDDLGGPRCPSVEMQGGVAGIPERAGINLLPAELMEKAWEGFNGDWRLLDPRLLPLLQASNRPDWLTALIDRSARVLGVKLIPTGTLGSDQLAFTQAGVVATGIGCASHLAHSPADTSANVKKENLRMVGQLAACVVGTAAAEATGLEPAKEGRRRDDTPASGARIAQTVAAISEGVDSVQRRSAILRRLDELNVKYHTEDFCSRSACGTNVVVHGDSQGGRTLMLGAHYDRVSKGKGAVDNAAGSAAILELLRKFRDRPLKNLALAVSFFDLEEVGLLGSKDYVARRRQQHELPAFYLNFDVFAYGDTLWVESDAASSALVHAIRTAATQQRFRLTVERKSPPGDDRVFRKARVETVGLGLVRQIELENIHKVVRGKKVATKPSLLKIMHTVEDTPDKVNADEVARALLVVEAAIRAIDASRQGSPRR